MCKLSLYWLLTRHVYMCKNTKLVELIVTCNNIPTFTSADGFSAASFEPTNRKWNLFGIPKFGSWYSKSRVPINTRSVRETKTMKNNFETPSFHANDAYTQEISLDSQNKSSPFGFCQRINYVYEKLSPQSREPALRNLTEQNKEKRDFE